MVNHGTLTNKKSIQLTRKFFTISVLLSPILRQYISFIPGVMLADIVLGVSCLLVILFNKNSILDWKIYPIIIFWVYGLFISLLSFLVQQSFDFQNLTRFVRYSFYLYLVIVANKYFLFKYAIKTFKYLSIFLSLYILLQVFFYNYLDIILPFKVLPFPLSRDIDIEQLTASISSSNFRPFGIFVEPGYAAQFMLPALALSLYGWSISGKNNLKTTILIIIALIMTGSGQAIFIGTAIIAVYLLSKLLSKQKYKHFIIRFGILLFVLILLPFLVRIDSIEYNINRLNVDIRPGSSIALRVYRGFAVFSELPSLYKGIGVGHGNLGEYTIANSIRTEYDPIIMTEATADYASAASIVLLYYGIFGFIILIYIYISFLKNTRGSIRLIVLTHMILSLVSGVIFTITMLFYFSFIYSGYNKRLYLEKKRNLD